MPFTSAYATFAAQATIGESVPPFNNANAYLGVGDGTTAFSPSQTDLQGTNKVRKPMNSGYPSRSGNTVTFQATFGASEANFSWNEWGVFNAATGGVMLNRKLESFGTKVAGTVWQFTVQLEWGVA
jgi:hypothetical protein